MTIALAAMIASLALTSCTDSYTDQVERLEKDFSRNQIGSSRDYLLVKAGIAGRDPVAVIFGFLDDGDFCRQVAELYMQRYSGDQYHCEPAN